MGDTMITVNRFRPHNETERRIWAEEGLLIDVQQAIYEAMLNAGVSKSELARRMGVTPGAITHLFSDHAMTIRTLARACHALGCECVVKVRQLEGHG
jgi:DNA-binding Xre family transcriptional regulator